MNLHKELPKFCMPRLILTLFSKFGFWRVIFFPFEKVLRWFSTSSSNFCVFLFFRYLVFGWVMMVVELHICLIYMGLIFGRRIYQRKVGLHFWKTLRPHKMAQFVPQLIKWQTMNSREKIMSLTQDWSHSLAWGKWPP